MENDNILDRWDDGFEENVKVVVVKYFYLESEASLYAARLKEAGIKSFLSNANVSTAIPIGHGGIGLHVRESDMAEALKIVKLLDDQNKKPIEESYEDADEEEIAYLKSLHEQEKGQDWMYWGIMLLIGFLILRAFLRASGIMNSFWDYF